MLNPLASLFAIPKHLNLPIENYKDFAIVSSAGVLGFISHCAFLVLFLLVKVYFMVYLNIGSLIIFASIYFINRHSIGKATILLILASFEIVIHATCAVIILGWDSNFHLYLFIPMLAALLTASTNTTLSDILNISYSIIYIFLAVYTNHFSAIITISTSGLFVFEVLNIISVSFIVIIVTRYYSHTAHHASQKLTKFNRKLKKQGDKLTIFNEELGRQAKELIKINNQTNDSIRYALRIQKAVLSSTSDLENLFGEKNVIVIYSPKDIISGDFYWATEIDKKKIIAVADCTGHGVPGAMLTMIGKSLLNNIILEKKITEPALILDALQHYFSTLFKNEQGIQDGMDICLCVFNETDSLNMRLVNFAGAKRPLFILKSDKLLQIQGSRKTIGGRQKKGSEYEQCEVLLNKGDILYLTTDGYVDQNNFLRKKYGTLRFKRLLTSFMGKTLNQQKKILLEEMKVHRQKEEQRDDITIIALKI